MANDRSAAARLRAGLRGLGALRGLADARQAGRRDRELGLAARHHHLAGSVAAAAQPCLAETVQRLAPVAAFEGIEGALVGMIVDA